MCYTLSKKLKIYILLTPHGVIIVNGVLEIASGIRWGFTG
jgi:hypothetical protein